jgi:hypothetical protein
VQWTLVGTTVALAFLGVTWLTDVPSTGPAPHGDYEPRRLNTWILTGADSSERRQDALRRAVFETGDATDRETEVLATIFAPDDLPSCRFVPAPLSGTSAKFDCVMEGGEIVKVKYGRNPEIHGETAATELLHLLGYPADRVTIVPRLRCYGCPRFPFVAAYLHDLFPLPLRQADEDEGFTEFEWVSVEQKFPAPAIETEEVEGWAWWELAGSDASRADVDAFRLTAMFLAHWDNKSENQRLVCLDGPPSQPNARCARPLAMIQDLGATFGPTKVNLARWRSMPLWSDRAQCTISMRAFPFRGASFPDAHISEAGRAKLAARLAAITDADVERFFTEARFPQFQVGTDDEGDLRAWVDAFRHRADQVVNVRCPALPNET